MALEFSYILIYSLISFALSCVIILASYVLALQNADMEKISAYECGFNPFENARFKFNVKYYLVAILFIIFDLEISFLFSWSINLENFVFFGFWTMFVFLVLLTVGFVYEWKKGALDW